jgi:hypothetical protein
MGERAEIGPDGVQQTTKMKLRLGNIGWYHIAHEKALC